jgi:hypothetical protein
MKAGIAVDNWKLPIFRKRLAFAGYEYQDGGPLTADATLLTVETSDMPGLTMVIEACQRECASQPPA